MVDVTTRKRLCVSTEAPQWPYIEVPKDQLDAVHQLLERHGVRHWVDEHVISMNDGPFMGIINLGRDGDAAAVQAILDAEA